MSALYPHLQIPGRSDMIDWFMPAAGLWKGTESCQYFKINDYATRETLENTTVCVCVHWFFLRDTAVNWPAWLMIDTVARLPRGIENRYLAIGILDKNQRMMQKDLGHVEDNPNLLIH